MQVDLYELLFIIENKERGLYSSVRRRLNVKGKRTKNGEPISIHTVANEVESIKSEYDEDIIKVLRETFRDEVGKEYKKP